MGGWRVWDKDRTGDRMQHQHPHSQRNPPSLQPRQNKQDTTVLKDAEERPAARAFKYPIGNSETGVSGPDLPRVPQASPGGQRASAVAVLAGLWGSRWTGGGTHESWGARLSRGLTHLPLAGPVPPLLLGSRNWAVNHPQCVEDVGRVQEQGPLPQVTSWGMEPDLILGHSPFPPRSLRLSPGKVLTRLPCTFPSSRLLIPPDFEEWGVPCGLAWHSCAWAHLLSS